MNSEEGMSLAKMAVSVLLVVLVIGAVVALVYTAYSWFNSGSDKLGDQVNSIDSSSYSQYDDAQVSGTDVLTALKTYRDSDIGIFVANGRNSKTGVYSQTQGDIAAYNYCGVAGTDAEADTSPLAADTIYTVKWNAPNFANMYTVENIVWTKTSGVAFRNTNFSPTTQKNKDAYIKQGAQFYSNLVYSQATGEVCGILFRQMGN